MIENIARENKNVLDQAEERRQPEGIFKDIM